MQYSCMIIEFGLKDQTPKYTNKNILKKNIVTTAAKFLTHNSVRGEYILSSL